MGREPSLAFGPPRAHKPEEVTVIPIAPVESPIAVRREPVSIFGARKTPAPAPASAGPKTPTLAFTGAVQRKQILLGYDEVKLKFPHLSSTQVALVIENVRETNIQVDSWQLLLEWGVDSQKQLATMLDKELQLVQSGSIQESKDRIAAIISQLDEFNDIVTNDGSFGHKLKSLFYDPKKDFEKKYTTLKLIVDALDASIPRLQQFARDTETYQKQSGAIKADVESAIAAGTCVLEYATAHKAELPNAPVSLLDNRVTSLITTLGTLAMGDTQRALLKDTINRLIDCIQNVLLTELPAWRTNYMAILTLDASDPQKRQQVVENFICSQTKLLTKLKV